MSKERPEDQLLDEGQFPRLNQTFYRSEPADYFERRLELLILHAGNPDGVAQLLKAGVTVGLLNLHAKDDSEDADPQRVAAHFTATEAEMLSHQVGETLLRLYLCHEFGGRICPTCPRLDLVRFRHGDEFRDRVASRFVKAKFESESNRRAVANVFHLTHKREAFGPETPSEDDWNTSLRLHELYLRHFARQFLDGAGLYNAAKHGLSLTPQEEAGVELAGIANRRGPAIHYLSVRQSPTELIPRWKEVIHWVEADMQMALIARAITQIRMLWAIARYRYVTPSEPKVQVGLLGGMSPEEIIFSGKDLSRPMIVSDMAISLRYWKRGDGAAGDVEAGDDVGTPSERVEARLGGLVPKGWRLCDPASVDNGWRLAIENIENPILSADVWDYNLDRAIEMLAAQIRAMR